MLRAVSLTIIVTAVFTTLAHAEGCNTELQQSDSNKEISGKLKCLNDRIGQLERRLTAGPQTGVGTAVVPGPLPTVIEGTPILPTGCFASDPYTTTKGTYTFEVTAKHPKVLCWNDGTVILTFAKVLDNGVKIIRVNGSEYVANYNNTAQYWLANNEQIKFTPQKLFSTEAEPSKFKVTVEYVGHN